MNALRRCTHCIMPDVPGIISFDEDGVCDQCRTYTPMSLKGERDLLHILDAHRTMRTDYDCIVTVSGGRDSSFTVLKLVRDYHLRVLAVNYDNPFVEKQAAKNIRNMVRSLGIELIQFRWKKGRHERIVADNLRTWLKKPSPAMVPAICVGCKVMWSSILKIARTHHIKCIVSGGNPYEYTSFKKTLLRVPQDASLMATYALNFFCLAGETLSNISYLKPRNVPWTVKGYLFGNQYSIGSRLAGFGMDTIDLFHYIPWDETEVLSQIEKELDWAAPASLSSTWRFDCRLSHLKDCMYLMSLGMTEKDDFYSKLIRERKITREEAMGRIRKENKVHREIIEDLFHQLNMKDIDVVSMLEKTGT